MIAIAGVLITPDEERGPFLTLRSSAFQAWELRWLLLPATVSPSQWLWLEAPPPCSLLSWP